MANPTSSDSWDWGLQCCGCLNCDKVSTGEGTGGESHPRRLGMLEYHLVFYANEDP